MNRFITVFLCILLTCQPVWAVTPQGERNVSPAGRVRSSDAQIETRQASGQVIPDGDYRIALSKDTTYYMDIDGIGLPAKSEKNVQIWQDKGWNPDCDAWTVKYNNGFYTITQYSTNMALDLYYGNTKDGTNVQIYPSHGGDSQKWTISKNGKNGFRIEAKSSGYSLDIEDGKLENKTNVRIWSNNDTDSQSWLFIPYKPEQTIENGRYILLSSLDPSLELDVEGESSSASSGTNVRIWNDTCLSKFNSFDVTKEENGYYRLSHAGSGKMLDASGASKKYASNIHLWGKNTTDAQLWAITKNSDGYMLRVRSSGYALDVEDSKTKDGTNVIQYPPHGGANQTWTFVQAEYTCSYDGNGGSNIPSSQTKYYKQDLTLSQIKPTKNGYTFKGWEANGGLYQPGDAYKADKDVKYVAQWAPAATPTVAPSQDPIGTVLNGPDGNYYKVSAAGSEVAFLKAGNKVTSLSVPNTIQINNTNYKVTSIAQEACKGNSRISSVKMGENVLSIGKNAFNGCSILKTLSLGENVKTIGPGAFQNCKKLLKVTLPKSVTTIGKNAFYRAAKLKALVIETTGLTSKNVGKNAFKGIYKKVTVTVPSACANNYKALLKSKGLPSSAKFK